MDLEKRILLRFLDAQRDRVPVILDGLPAAALRRPVLPSGWSCLDLVHHLALEERLWLRGIVGGQPVALPESADDDRAEWRVDAAATPEEVLGLYRDEIARANAVLEAVSLDAPPRRLFSRWPDWHIRDVRWVVLHLIEETARHLGHLDVARELLDGRTGLAQDRTGA
ncbi:DinB family protein [Rugosimonospora acidiphila]|uniref:DinB family protein n=1 Tax=Rugosimonospora acidiphila TaxID=556531 RepID=A0ABP9SQG1_9ACTN